MTGSSSKDGLAPRSGLVAVVLTVPLLSASLGVDGGPIFQIVAVEDLSISGTALAMAFGLGLLTVPVQVAAARFPIRWARRNLQLFLIACAFLTWVLAALVAFGTSGMFITIALAITILAELSVSVLYATAWQPLLASLSPIERQRLNSIYPAAARVGLASAVAIFGSVAGQLRTAFLIGVGVLALVTARALGSVGTPAVEGERAAAKGFKKSRLSKPLKKTFMAIAVTNLGAMPLWLVYVDEVAWPQGNLGLIAAVQIIASTLAMAAWRPTAHAVINRAFGGCVLMALAAASVPFVHGPNPDRSDAVLVLAASALMGLGTSITRMALVEHTHRLVERTEAVKAFTILDVIASTSLQAGLSLAGVLIAKAATTSGSPLNPYEILLVTSTVAALIFTWQLRGDSGLPSSSRTTSR